MNVQQKQLVTSRIVSSAVGEATIVVFKNFLDAPAVNVHGLTVTFGVTPAGPDESFLGRWYLCNLPHSIVDDTGILNDWIDNLDDLTTTNNHLESTTMVWGAGSFTCAEQSTFQHTFSPKTSRNMQRGSGLYLIVVADAISGVLDDWDANGMLTYFISS